MISSQTRDFLGLRVRFPQCVGVRAPRTSLGLVSIVVSPSRNVSVLPVFYYVSSEVLSEGGLDVWTPDALRPEWSVTPFDLFFSSSLSHGISSPRHYPRFRQWWRTGSRVLQERPGSEGRLRCPGLVPWRWGSDCWFCCLWEHRVRGVWVTVVRCPYVVGRSPLPPV